MRLRKRPRGVPGEQNMRLVEAPWQFSNTAKKWKQAMDLHGYQSEKPRIRKADRARRRLQQRGMQAGARAWPGLVAKSDRWLD